MILSIAWRNIWRNKTRSIVIMLSVTVGLFAGISVMALYKGMMRSRIRTVIDAETSHLQLHTRDFKKDYEPVFVLPHSYDLLKQVRSMNGIQLAAPRSITHGMLSTPTGSSGVQVNGVEPESEYKISQLKKKIIAGNGFSGKSNEIIIGKKLADKMKLKPAAKLVLTFTDSSDNMVAGAFRVAAIYHSDNAPLDEKNVYVLLTDLNTLLGLDSSFHEIAVLLNNDDSLTVIQAALQQKFPGLLVESWKDISPETSLMVNTVDEYSYIILVIIMVALAFGIINTMLMAVLERTVEIGMMVALGMNRKRLLLLIVMETVILTLAGTPVGLLLGLIITGYYHKNGLDLSGFGKEMMSSFGYTTMVYPEFPWERLAGIMIIVSGTALLSCLFPAIKALRLRPVEALRR